MVVGPIFIAKISELKESANKIRFYHSSLSDSLLNVTEDEAEAWRQFQIGLASVIDVVDITCEEGASATAGAVEARNQSSIIYVFIGREPYLLSLIEV